MGWGIRKTSIVAAVFRLNSTRPWLLAAAAAVATSSAIAQQTDQAGQPAPVDTTQALRLPENPQVFGTAMPSVVKATAIVNGDVITQTDVDQRLALLAIANGGKIPPDQVDTLRQQVLRNLIDETLEIQAAKAEKIEIKSSDIDQTVTRVAANVKQTPDQLKDFLTANNSSMRSLRRQIEGEISWQRLQRAKIESGVSVGDEEVKAVLEKMTASKGTEEYRVGEIFLSSTPDTQSQNSRECKQDPRAVAQRRLFRRLCAPIFGSFDCSGRWRSWMGPPRAAPDAACGGCS